PDFYGNVSVQDDNINKLLPSSFSAGIGLQLDQILFAVEYKQHTNTTLNQAEYSTFHIGNEITLFSVFDIRSGIIFNSDENTTFSAGLGLDTAYFSISAGAYARQIDN